MEDGKSVDGIMAASFVDFESMGKLWGKKVTVKGKALYKPSGKLRTVEAHLVKLFEPGDEVLQKIPGVRKRVKYTDSLLMEKKSNSDALRKIRGKWPGDEPIEELLDLLSS